MLKPLKQIELIAPDVDELSHFDLVTAAGRDAIAERIEKDINDWCQQQYDDGPRTHLGASLIGVDCQRYLWFSFRWMFFQKFSGRMQRVFQRGHLEEERIITWLTGIGFNITKASLDGKQLRIAFADTHGGGSTDGISILPTRYGNFEPLLLELKTQKDKKFSILQGSGVQKEKPQHYVQMCIYGRYLQLHYALYIAVNKENDDLNIEIIELDWSLADAEISKTERIINSQTPPPRISENPSFWTCKYCPALDICHLNGTIERNCRSCISAEPVSNGQWQCNRWKSLIPSEAIKDGCSSWISLPTK